MQADSFLALGDSYTVGEGVPEAQCWPAVVARLLRARGVALADPQIVAVTGWTTDELAAGMQASLLHPPYALVTLLIGVNNQYRGLDPQQYRHEYAALLARAIALAGGRPGRVLGVSIPDWGVTAFARRENRDRARIADELDALNAEAAAQLAAAGAAWADITPLSRRAGGQSQMLAADGLHPSGVQYAQWAEVIAARICAILNG